MRRYTTKKELVQNLADQMKWRREEAALLNGNIQGQINFRIDQEKKHAQLVAHLERVIDGLRQQISEKDRDTKKLGRLANDLENKVATLENEVKYLKSALESEIERLRNVERRHSEEAGFNNLLGNHYEKGEGPPTSTRSSYGREVVVQGRRLKR